MAQAGQGEFESPNAPRKPASESNSFLRAARNGQLDRVLEFLNQPGFDINTSNANGLAALHLASKEGHVNIVYELLKRGANVDAATKKGNTALHIASLAGQFEVVKLLIQYGGKVNTQSQNGFTPLYMAAQENHFEVVHFLLANGANQNITTDDGFTPLAVALQQGHERVVALLIENDTRGRVRLPALHIAAKKDDVKAAALLLQQEPDAIAIQATSGFTPLHIASHYGNVNVATLLIERGADVNFPAKNNICPLHVAAKWGKSGIVQLLLEHHAAVDCLTKDGLTPLHCAARSGQNQVLELLLTAGANYEATTKNGLTPLHMAAQGDHVDCARMLLNKGARVDDITIDNLTPLHVASHCGNVRMAKLLIERSCDINSKATNGFTPLHVACKKNRVKVVELLMRYGANLEAATESGLTSLHVSAFMGHQNIVLLLLQTGGASPNATTQRGETPLHLAARASQLEIVRILLRHGAQVDAKAKENQTALHIACRLGNAEVAALLLQQGANPDAMTRDNYTALHIAAKEGHEEVTQVLLDHGAKVDTTTRKGFTALHICAKYSRVKVARLLLHKKANADLQGKNGLTPLHVAVHYNSMPMTLLLLESKGNANAAAKNGYTALHIAAKKGLLDAVNTLLEFGAKPNVESKNGFTPLHLASQEGHSELVNLLLRHEANPNCKAKNGLTPMHLAAQDDRVNVAQMLVNYKADINIQTKAGYTPLHTACHFGCINMVMFLLRCQANVDMQTKLGYTPLHLASQQGHMNVVNALLEHGANTNLLTSTEQSALSIAKQQNFGEIAQLLEARTTVQAATMPAGAEMKMVAPEMMQEAYMSEEDEEEGGAELNQSLSENITLRAYKNSKRSHSAARSQENMVSIHNPRATSTLRSTASGLGIDDMYYEVTGSTPTRSASQPRASAQENRTDFLESIEDINRQMEYMPYSENYGQASSPNTLGQPSMRDSYNKQAVVRGGDSLTSIMWDAYSYGVAAAAPTLTVSPPRSAEEQAAGQQQDINYLKDPAIMPGKDILEEQQPNQPATLEESAFDPTRVPPIEEKMTREGTATVHAAPPTSGLASEGDLGFGFDPDNVALDRTPTFSGFLVSFMVDARGGALSGARYPGLRIMVPPRAASMPTRITCRLLRKERLAHLPQLNAGEGLATRIIEMGPTNLKFNTPVLIEVPHFASLRDGQREVCVMRSDNGEKWTEHNMDATDAAVKDSMGNLFGDIEPYADLQKKRVARILTNDFPMYFALITRIHQQLEQVGPEGGLINAKLVPQVQAVFPEGALQKRIKIGLQAHPMPSDLVVKLFGPSALGVTVGPCVTIEPRRRKFHKPITLAIPIAKQYQSNQLNVQPNEAQTLRLLCSITGGSAPAQWEDITGSTSLQLVRGCITFTTTVSARFWLIDTPNPSEAVEIAKRLYQDQTVVPYFSSYVVYAKRTDANEARLRVFCVTDDRCEKTLETHEKFVEVARSKPVEVIDAKPQYLQMTGNLVPLLVQGEEQPHLNFQAFRENRMPLQVRVREGGQPASGRLVLEKESVQQRLSAPPLPPGQNPAPPLVVLNLQLPEMGAVPQAPAEVSPELMAKLQPKIQELKVMEISEEYFQAQVRISDIAREIGPDWVALASVLAVPRAQVDQIRSEYDTTFEQAMEMLIYWTKMRGEHATGNQLENALREIDRGDILRRVQFNERKLEHDEERALADRISGGDEQGVPSAKPPAPPSPSAAQDGAATEKLPSRPASFTPFPPESDEAPPKEKLPSPVPVRAVEGDKVVTPTDRDSILMQHILIEKPQDRASQQEFKSDDEELVAAVKTVKGKPASEEKKPSSEANKQVLLNLVNALESMPEPDLPEPALRAGVADTAGEEEGAITATKKKDEHAINYRPGVTKLGNAAPSGGDQPEEEETGEQATTVSKKSAQVHATPVPPDERRFSGGSIERGEEDLSLRPAAADGTDGGM